MLRTMLYSKSYTMLWLSGCTRNAHNTKMCIQHSSHCWACQESFTYSLSLKFPSPPTVSNDNPFLFSLYMGAVVMNSAMREQKFQCWTPRFSTGSLFTYSLSLMLPSPTGGSDNPTFPFIFALYIGAVVEDVQSVAKSLSRMHQSPTKI